MRDLQADLEAEQQRSCAAGPFFVFVRLFTFYVFDTAGSFLSVITLTTYKSWGPPGPAF